MSTGEGLRGSRPARRILFVNEDLGGHETMHLAIRTVLETIDDVEAVFVDVPRAGTFRRAIGASLPGLARLDLDFQPLRYQLAQSAVARRLVRDAIASSPPFDVIHVYTQSVALGSEGLLRRHPTVVSTDNSATQLAFSVAYRAAGRFTPLAARVANRFERRIYGASTMAVAQSEWAAASLRETCELGGERLRVIPFGILAADLPPRRDPPGLPQITFVGTRLGRKGGDSLRRVWRERLRERSLLNLVTHDAVPEEPGIRVLRDLRPGDPRLLELLAATAVFALPTDMDKSPYAILEAMRSGVPVVSTDVAGIPELVDDGVTGSLVEVGDDAQLGRALERLLDDAPLRARMGEAAQRRVRERFDATVTTRALLDVLDEAVVRHTERIRTGGRG